MGFQWLPQEVPLLSQTLNNLSRMTPLCLLCNSSPENSRRVPQERYSTGLHLQGFRYTGVDPWGTTSKQVWFKRYPGVLSGKTNDFDREIIIQRSKGLYSKSPRQQEAAKAGATHAFSRLLVTSISGKLPMLTPGAVYSGVEVHVSSGEMEGFW